MAPFERRIGWQSRSARGLLCAAAIVSVSLLAPAIASATPPPAPVSRASPTATRVAYLRTISRRSQAIDRLLVIGRSARRVRAFAAATPGVSISMNADGIVIQLDPRVRVFVTLGPGDIVLGSSSTGMRELMGALGVDFAGNPYTPGN